MQSAHASDWRVAAPHERVDRRADLPMTSVLVFGRLVSSFGTEGVEARAGSVSLADLRYLRATDRLHGSESGEERSRGLSRARDDLLFARNLAVAHDHAPFAHDAVDDVSARAVDKVTR